MKPALLTMLALVAVAPALAHDRASESDGMVRAHPDGFAKERAPADAFFNVVPVALGSGPLSPLKLRAFIGPGVVATIDGPDVRFHPFGEAIDVPRNCPPPICYPVTAFLRRYRPARH